MWVYISEYDVLKQTFVYKVGVNFGWTSLFINKLSVKCF